LRICCICLVDSVESMTMHGLANPKSNDYVYANVLYFNLGKLYERKHQIYEIFVINFYFVSKPWPHSIDSIGLPVGTSATSFCFMLAPPSKMSPRQVYHCDRSLCGDGRKQTFTLRFDINLVLCQVCTNGLCFHLLFLFYAFFTLSSLQFSVICAVSPLLTQYDYEYE